jgi:hypothetical protein
MCRIRDENRFNLIWKNSQLYFREYVYMRCSSALCSAGVPLIQCNVYAGCSNTVSSCTVVRARAYNFRAFIRHIDTRKLDAYNLNACKSAIEQKITLIPEIIQWAPVTAWDKCCKTFADIYVVRKQICRRAVANYCKSGNPILHETVQFQHVSEIQLW